jgi:1-acyl-sn-glycerol-3-phosphate acyltransferase
MAEDSINTSDYWRKLLKMDETDPKVLGGFNYLHRTLRPAFFRVFGAIADRYWKFKVSGLQNIPGTPPYIVAPNHTSSLDYALVAYAMGEAARKDLYVLATSIFYDIGFTRFFMKIAANVQRIESRADYMSALRAAAQILKQGRSIYINPEGTRSKTGEVLPFKPGIGLLACELKIPVVPVNIHGAAACLPSGSVFPKPGRIEVTFGRPITMEGFSEQLAHGNAYFVYKAAADKVRDAVLTMRNAR